MTEKDVLKLLQNIYIVCDTREQKNAHILKYFEENNIPFVKKKLDYGDYSCEFANIDNPKMVNFSIERKGSLDEIVGNFTKGRDRFEREYQRMLDDGGRMNLVLESGSWTKIFNGSYRSEVHPNNIIANIVRLEEKFHCPVYFCKPSESGQLIYNLIIWNVKRILKK